MKEKQLRIKPMRDLTQFKFDNIQDVNYSIQQHDSLTILPEEISINKNSWRRWERVSVKLKKNYS